MSLRAIGKAVGVTPQSVHQWESGRSAVPSQDIPTIAATLGVSLDELFGQPASAPMPAHPRPRMRTGETVAEYVARRLSEQWGDLPADEQQMIESFVDWLSAWRARLLAQEGSAGAERVPS